jgi:CheY-like chemotaxis protein
MDCHMPVMDGYESTRNIRQYELLNGRKPTPVFALTANVVSGDKDKALATGMTGYLTKPYTLMQIYEALARISNPQLLNHEGGVPALAAPPNSRTTVAVPTLPGTKPVKPETDSVILDEVFLNEISEIDDANNNALVREIIGLYLQDSIGSLEEVRACVKKRHPQELAVAAHALKSMSVSIGGRALGELCHLLEVAGRNNEVGNIAQVMVRLDNQYLKLIAALEHYRDLNCAVV